MKKSPIKEVIKQFVLPGELVSVHPYKVGHINETFISVWREGKAQKRYLHQKVNNYVFKDVPAVMRNIERALAIIKEQSPDAKNETLNIIPTQQAASYLVTESGEYWRTYEFIEGTISFEVCAEPKQAYEAAKVMGRFLRYLSKAAVGDFVETIPLFQNVPNRFVQFDQALAVDTEGRAKEAAQEIAFAQERRVFARYAEDLVHQGKIPVRITHSDPKFNNILFERLEGDRYGRGVAVVDLDTIMPGTIIYDFGDMARSVIVAAREDETDLAKVTINRELFSELARGYLEEAGPLLTKAEIDALALAPRLVALSLGTRFLTDYINGDVYFKIHRLNHNLERARTQFRIVSEMERLEEDLQEVVGSALKGLKK